MGRARFRLDCWNLWNGWWRLFLNHVPINFYIMVFLRIMPSIESRYCRSIEEYTDSRFEPTFSISQKYPSNPFGAISYAKIKSLNHTKIQGNSINQKTTNSRLIRIGTKRPTHMKPFMNVPLYVQQSRSPFIERDVVKRNTEADLKNG